MIEHDHRKAPQRCYPMLGFKTFGNQVWEAPLAA